jgi:outer membrane protein, adhesin transport system
MINSEDIFIVMKLICLFFNFSNMESIMCQKGSLLLLCVAAIMFHAMCFAQQNGEDVGTQRYVLESSGVTEVLKEAGPSTGIDLSSALQAALKDNPQFLFSQLDFASAEASFRAEYGKLLPSLDISASIGGIKTRNDISGSESQDGSAMTNRQRLVLSQLIYDGGVTSSTVEAKKHFSESKKHEHFKKAEQVALMATQSFVEVIRNRGLVALCKHNISEHEYIAELTRVRLSSGGGSRADVSQAEAALDEARSRLIQAEQGLADAAASYAAVFGVSPGPLAMPERLVNAIPIGIPEAVDLALGNDNALKAAKFGVKQKGEELEAAQGVFMPRVRLELSAENSQNTGGYTSSYNDLSGLLAFDLNLFNGGSDQQSLRQARHEAGKARQDVERVRREVTEDMETAYNFYKATWELVPVLKETVDKNAEVVSGYADQFRMGRRTLLDLVSRKRRFSAPSRYI